MKHEVLTTFTVDTQNETSCSEELYGTKHATHARDVPVPFKPEMIREIMRTLETGYMNYSSSIFLCLISYCYQFYAMVSTCRSIRTSFATKF